MLQGARRETTYARLYTRNYELQIKFENALDLIGFAGAAAERLVLHPHQSFSFTELVGSDDDQCRFIVWKQIYHIFAICLFTLKTF